MRVSIDNKYEQYLERDIDQINNWWIDATSRVYRDNRLIYCVDIDGKPMYEGYERVIIENYAQLKEINIQTKNRQESIVETVQLMGDYLKEFIPASIAIADYFYGDISTSQWNEFTQFLRGLHWIVKSFEFLQSLSLSDDKNTISLSIKQLESIIAEMDQSLQNQEHVQVGDLIQYELVPILKKIQLV